VQVQVLVQVLGQWEADNKKKKLMYRRHLSTELAEATVDGLGGRAGPELGLVGSTPLVDGAGGGGSDGCVGVLLGEAA
jgi:hypothetical protein